MSRDGSVGAPTITELDLALRHTGLAGSQLAGLRTVIDTMQARLRGQGLHPIVRNLQRVDTGMACLAQRVTTIEHCASRARAAADSCPADATPAQVITLFGGEVVAGINAAIDLRFPRFAGGFVIWRRRTPALR